jgi:hypothetical protein
LFPQRALLGSLDLAKARASVLSPAPQQHWPRFRDFWFRGAWLTSAHFIDRQFERLCETLDFFVTHVAIALFNARIAGRFNSGRKRERRLAREIFGPQFFEPVSRHYDTFIADVGTGRLPVVRTARQ